MEDKVYSLEDLGGDYELAFLDRLKEYAPPDAPDIDDTDIEVVKNFPHFTEACDESLKNEFENVDEFWKIFVSLSAPESEKNYTEIKEFGPEEKIIESGDSSKSVFWLLRGKVEIYSNVDEKYLHVNSYSKTGDCFGELTAMLGATRTADAIASKSGGAKVLIVDWSTATISDVPELGIFLYALMAKTLAKKLVESYKKPIETAKKALKQIMSAKKESIKIQKENSELKSRLSKYVSQLEEAEKQSAHDQIEDAIGSMKKLLLQMDKRG
jgi:CRP-like cAMP-binding protein